VLGDQHDPVRIGQLSPQERAVEFRRVGGGRKKATAIEIVMFLDEERPQTAKTVNVVSERWTDLRLDHWGRTSPTSPYQ